MYLWYGKMQEIFTFYVKLLTHIIRTKKLFKYKNSKRKYNNYFYKIYKTVNILTLATIVNKIVKWPKSINIS